MCYFQPCFGQHTQLNRGIFCRFCFYNICRFFLCFEQNFRFLTICCFKKYISRQQKQSLKERWCTAIYTKDLSRQNPYILSQMVIVKRYKFVMNRSVKIKRGAPNMLNEKTKIFLDLIRYLQVLSNILCSILHQTQKNHRTQYSIY